MDKKIILIEDGSVDLDELDEQLKNTNIEYLVYKQGSSKPELLNIPEFNNEINIKKNPENNSKEKNLKILANFLDEVCSTEKFFEPIANQYMIKTRFLGTKEDFVSGFKEYLEQNKGLDLID